MLKFKFPLVLVIYILIDGGFCNEIQTKQAYPENVLRNFLKCSTDESNKNRPTINHILAFIDKLSQIFRKLRNTIPKPNQMLEFKYWHVYESIKLRPILEKIPKFMLSLLDQFSNCIECLIQTEATTIKTNTLRPTKPATKIPITAKQPSSTSRTTTISPIMISTESTIDTTATIDATSSSSTITTEQSTDTSPSTSTTELTTDTTPSSSTMTTEQSTDTSLSASTTELTTDTTPSSSTMTTEQSTDTSPSTSTTELTTDTTPSSSIMTTEQSTDTSLSASTTELTTDTTPSSSTMTTEQSTDTSPSTSTTELTTDTTPFSSTMTTEQSTDTSSTTESTTGATTSMDTISSKTTQKTIDTKSGIDPSNAFEEILNELHANYSSSLSNLFNFTGNRIRRIKRSLTFENYKRVNNYYRSGNLYRITKSDQDKLIVILDDITRFLTKWAKLIEPVKTNVKFFLIKLNGKNFAKTLSEMILARFLAAKIKLLGFAVQRDSTEIANKGDSFLTKMQNKEVMKNSIRLMRIAAQLPDIFIYNIVGKCPFKLYMS